MKAKVIRTGKEVEVSIDLCAQPLIDSGARYVLRTKDGRSFLDTELQFIKCDPHKEYITSLIKGKRKSYE